MSPVHQAFVGMLVLSTLLVVTIVLYGMELARNAHITETERKEAFIEGMAYQADQELRLRAVNLQWYTDRILKEPHNVK